MPTEGYLETSEGPIALGDVEWVQMSTRRIVGGIAGRPRKMVDIRDDILSALRAIDATWDLHEDSWSVEGILNEEAVQVVRVLNPFRRMPARVS